MCVRVHVRVWIRGYCKMPEKGVIAISVNLMELKGPTDVSKYRYCLQSTLLCLGSMLCIWGTRYNRIRLRNHPYRNVSVCLCACLCPCVFNMRHKFWVTCPGPLISSNHTGLTYQQVLFLHFCCLFISQRCFHIIGLCSAMDFFITRCMNPFSSEQSCSRHFQLFRFNREA